MGKQHQQKYHQWMKGDSLTLEEERVKLRKLLEKKTGRKFPRSSSVSRLLSQYEHFERTGYIN